MADNPDWQHLVENVPVMATWDNHDHGHHSAGEEFPLKEQSRAIFLDFFAEPTDSVRRQTPGIYTSQVFGPEGRRVQIILLDTRSFKSAHLLAERPEGAGGSLGKYAPNADAGASLLGKRQWDWLAQQLTQPAELRIVASSGQVVADQKGMDESGNYPHERQRLLELLTGVGDGAVLLLSGNVHFSKISAVSVGDRRLVDFTSSGLTHVKEAYSTVDNPYRVAGPFVRESFGLVEIEWQDRQVSLTLSAVDLKGQPAFSYQMDLPL